MASKDEIVTLDVGGTLFKTTLTTLRQYPGSMLAAMFDPSSGRPPAIKVLENHLGNFQLAVMCRDRQKGGAVC